MKPIRLIVIIAVVGLLAATGVWLGTEKTDARRALQNYRAQLQAQGEKLSWAEWGYPRAVESNDCLPRLVAAMGRVGNSGFNPGYLRWMDVSHPTNCEPIWVRPEVWLSDKSRPALAWSEFAEELAGVHAALAEVRAALTQPPGWLITDPTNLSVRPKFHFVEQRNAAQWLAAELVLALRQEDRGLALTNLHALQQLLKLHEADPTLVVQMIRVAIAGLALAATWEALAAPDWTEAELAALQASWERFNLFRKLEMGLLGERLFAESIFERLAGMNSERQVQYLNGLLGGTVRPNLEYFWQVFVTTPIWRMNREADQLLALQYQQRNLEAVRRLTLGTNWAAVQRSFADNQATFDAATQGPVQGLRYAMSALIIPNLFKAAQTTIRQETLRRLTVTAIALKRYELQHRTRPSSLAMLVPQFLAAVPVDPMNSRPLNYRTDSTGFVLYSVGEDGVDDGGDAQSPADIKQREICSGKDFIWPVPVATVRR